MRSVTSYLRQADIAREILKPSVRPEEIEDRPHEGAADDNDIVTLVHHVERGAGFEIPKTR